MSKPMLPKANNRLPLKHVSTAFSDEFRLAGWGLISAAAALLLTSCGRPGAGPGQMMPAMAAEVTTVTLKPQAVVLTSELPGRTSPYRIADIRPQVNGLILKRLFTEGTDVTAGQELYQIDPAPFQAAVDNAQAALDRAEANLPAIRARAERFKELINDKAVSQQNYDDAAAALRLAEADVKYFKATLESARINLNYARVVSPISGRIGASSVTDGAIVTAYQPMPLATIQQLDPIYVDVPQSTAELTRLQRRLEDGRLARDEAAQNKVQLVLEDGTPYPLEGTLQFRDVSVNQSTGSVTLRMVFPNPHGTLLPGMFVRARVKEGVNENAILLPQQAVVRDPRGNPLAMVVDANNTAQARPLKLDRAIGDKWLVTAGLAAGDRVIVEGLIRVRPGAPVREGPPAGAGPGTAPAGAAPGKAPAGSAPQTAPKSK